MYFLRVLWRWFLGLFGVPNINVTMHCAYWAYDQAQNFPCFFIGVTNVGRTDAVVERVRLLDYDFNMAIEIVNPERPLPFRLPPGAKWETWVRAPYAPQTGDAIFDRARVILTTGEVFGSEERILDKGQWGFVPDGKN